MQCLEASLRENQEPVQLLLPSVEIAPGYEARRGHVDPPSRLQLMHVVMERDVEQMLGPRSQPAEGWCRIDGAESTGTERRRQGDCVRKLPVVPARSAVALAAVGKT